MFKYLENFDRAMFLWLNSLNADCLDPIMFFVSSNYFWIPVVVIAIWLIIRKYGKKSWLPIIFLILAFVCTDQITNLVKHSVERYRPSHNIEIQHIVHIVNDYKGGMFSFFSGHAANSFGLAVLTALFIKKSYYTYPVLAWAILVSYSRIYLGVHYPADIVAGAFFGILTALVLYFLWKLLNSIISNRNHQSDI